MKPIEDSSITGERIPPAAAIATQLQCALRPHPHWRDRVWARIRLGDMGPAQPAPHAAKTRRHTLCALLTAAAAVGAWLVVHVASLPDSATQSPVQRAEARADRQRSQSVDSTTQQFLQRISDLTAQLQRESVCGRELRQRNTARQRPTSERRTGAAQTAERTNEAQRKRGAACDADDALCGL